MKKITAFILALSLSLCFAGCSEDGASSSKADSSSGASSVVDFEVKDNSQADDGSDSSAADSELPSGNGDTVFTGLTVVDNDYAKITYVKSAHDEYLGFTVTLFIENKSDIDIATILSHTLVNGKECEPYFTHEVKAGKMSYAYLGWFTTSFEEAGIDTVEKVEGTFYIVDSNDYYGDTLASEKVTIEPTNTTPKSEQLHRSILYGFIGVKPF